VTGGAAGPPGPRPSTPSSTSQSVPVAVIRALREGVHADPHGVLGPHAEGTGVVVRAWHPEAQAAECLLEGGATLPLEAAGEGLFEAHVDGADPALRYRLRFRFADGGSWERDDPYRFAPTPGPLDLHLINEGRHQRLWEVLGANPRRHGGVAGVSFAVWAPNARGVSLVGDFCAWDPRLLPMRALGRSGVFELFVPGVTHGAEYKFEIRTRDGGRRKKSDPLAREQGPPPHGNARVSFSSYAWGDGAWLEARARHEPWREPLSIYEVHLGSWARVPEEGHRCLGYRELAPRLVAHAHRYGFTHLELLPVMEHPYTPSWGYQVTGYYAPTARYGSPDDLRAFVDACHQAGVGVILDWVPAHFPKDDYALRRFDGTTLYEHADPQRGEHPDWGTLIFDYGRNEVRNFLTANALYWLDAFHVDGLRVDAVASMLYLDYSRAEGEWERNRHGGRENLEAIAFLRELNETISAAAPGCFTIAEESTAWEGVTRPVAEGGLGFTFKWNLGWMHDTLRYFGRDPAERRFHHDDLTFAGVYDQSERFVLPLSHDEVVHGKGSLLARMPGDAWQKFANLRVLLAYQWTRPGRPLVFMGTEFAPDAEWSCDASLDWHLAGDPLRAGLERFLADLGALYRELPCLWRWDHDPSGFQWVDSRDAESSVLAYLRWDGDAHAVVVLNLTTTARDGHRIGVPARGAYAQALSSDAAVYGGSGHPSRVAANVEEVPSHGFARSLVLDLPPLAALVLRPLRA
jgi:1,4-alpha-glucan branching enzyme